MKGIVSRLVSVWACSGIGLLLASCILAPGKFTSSLMLDADRNFIYRYQGEVRAQDPSGGMAQMPSSDEDTEKAAAAAKKKADQERKYKAVADQLKREHGMKEAIYLGNGKFKIDYELTGTLSHSFVFPFNTDAEIMVPFFAIELRKDGVARVKAAGYVGQQPAAPGAPPMGENTEIDGQFTVITNAKVQMHNAEETKTSAAGRQEFSWKITPLTKEAPSLTVRF
jgi:hypothetical protein